MISPAVLPSVFDNSHHAATLPRKLSRRSNWGPNTFSGILPRYFAHRRRRHLSLWDSAAFTNPLREFRPSHAGLGILAAWV